MRLVDSDVGDSLSRLVGGRLRGAPRGPGSEGPPMMGGYGLRSQRAVAPGIGELRDYESVGIFRHWGWVFVAGRIFR